MKDSKSLLKLVVLSMLIALGVVISPLLRVEGMCPMAHFINIVCSVLLGPWYSLLCAVVIGILRMTLMGIPPLALTGAVFGAFLSGVLYRLETRASEGVAYLHSLPGHDGLRCFPAVLSDRRGCIGYASIHVHVGMIVGQYAFHLSAFDCQHGVFCCISRQGCQ